MEIQQPKRVEKTWGYELWIHNDKDYCGKLLVFPEQFSRFSLHYHILKKETWYIQSGSFEFHWIDTENGKLIIDFLKTGDVVVVDRGQPHQLISLEENSIVFEVSTEHFDEDSYRIYRNNPNDLKE
jgi:mannose-6-phosphate isomerase-like protein (cupin superfamily)